MSQVLIGIIVVNGGLALIVLMVIGIVLKVLLTICLLLMYFIKYIITFIPIKIKEYFYKKKFLIKKIITILIILTLGKISYNIYNIEYNLTLEDKIKIMFMDAHRSEKLLKNEKFEVYTEDSGLTGYQISYLEYVIGKDEYLVYFWPENIEIIEYDTTKKDDNLKLMINKNNYTVYSNDAEFNEMYIEKFEKKISNEINKVYSAYITSYYDSKNKKYFWINYLEAKLDL